ncbi:MAG: deoxyribose-phosphate aldolase [Acidimicrobiia bacterium]
MSLAAYEAHLPSLSGRVRAVTPVDEVGLVERAASFATRSIKAESKAAALDLVVRCIDLTTLEGTDTPQKVRALCAKALQGDPFLSRVPPVAAVCVYPALVGVAATELAGSTVKVASVAGSFPAGLGPLSVRLEEIRLAVAEGADEIDIVLNRAAFLAGDYGRAFDEIVAAKEAAESAHLKVILETGELGSYDQIRRASMLAMSAGADFIKTSTGKIGTSATPPTALCMAEAIRDHAEVSGEMIGLKLAGGIRSAKAAWQYLVLIQETLGAAWLDPNYLRFGASSLLNDVLMQMARQASGRYQRPTDFSAD